VFALQVEGRPPTRGGLRYLTFTTMALPGLMVTHWLLERYAVTPDETGLLTAAAILLSVSFAMLLGTVPFHAWVSSVIDDGMPLAGAFVLTVSNGTIWFLLLDFLETYPWLQGHALFGPVLSAAGLVMVVFGGLLAAGRRRLGPLVGYASLVDSGAALIALGMSSSVGVTLAIFSLLVRPIGLILLASGLSGLRERSGGSDQIEDIQGLGWKAPWSTAALILGTMSVAGWPISAGFVARWALGRELMAHSPTTALLLLLAGVAVMMGMWRGLSALLTRPRESKDRSVFSGVSSEGWVTAVVVIAAMLVCVGIGLFPQGLASVAVSLAGGAFLP